MYNHKFSSEIKLIIKARIQKGFNFFLYYCILTYLHISSDITEHSIDSYHFNKRPLILKLKGDKFLERVVLIQET